MSREDRIRKLARMLVIGGAIVTGCSKEPPRAEPPPAPSAAPVAAPATAPSEPPAAAAAAAPAQEPPAPPAVPTGDPAASAIGEPTKPLPSSLDPPGKSPRQKRLEAKRARDAAAAAAGQGSGEPAKSGW